MTEEQATAAPGSSPWDLLATELQRLRDSVGSPSYGAIAQQVTERRKAAGASEHAARVARSTVYDCFRPGRVRVNVTLVREIADVLGAPDSAVDEWIARCREPRPTAPPPVEPAANPDAEAPHSAEPLGPSRLALLVGGAVALNVAGGMFHQVLELPVFLDMVGTAIAAIALGPWWGALVGVLTNVAGVTTSGTMSLPFMLVNVAGALTWGYGVCRWRLGRTLPRFFCLNLLVAAACTAVAVPLLLLLFDGSTGHGQQSISATLMQLTGSQVVSVAGSNLVVSVGDKMISGFVALVAIAALPLSVRARSGLDLLSGHPRD